MCITVYGLKPPCSSSNSFNQGYYGFKRDLEDAVGNADQKDNDETQQGSNTSNSSTETGPSAELRSFAEPLMTFPT